MNEETEVRRLQLRQLQQYEADIRLSNDCLDHFKDMAKGGPIAYILARAAAEAADAHIALSLVEPSNIKEIVRHQSDIARNRDIVRWISEAIARGKEAWDLKRGFEREDILNGVLDSIDEE